MRMMACIPKLAAAPLGALILIGAAIAPSASRAAERFDVAAAKQRINVVLDKDYPELDALYKDIHAHPELAFQEARTSALLAARMRALGFQVIEHVGGTGVVALYRNGAGPTVLVRTELDALPMEEKTGLPYASRVQATWTERPGIVLTPDQKGDRKPRIMMPGATTFVAHSCGHDAHMAWWVGTAEALLAMKDQWHGTLMFIGQPAETVSGAKAMLDDGLFTRLPKPDYGFAAHVGPEPAGLVTIKDGTMSSASDALDIVFNGRGGHGSMPDKTIDPIAMGAHFVSDVQTVISREKDPQAFGVVTVGSFQAGTVDNIIPDKAELKLTLRSYTPEVRKLLINGVETTANAAAAMAGAPAPTITYLHGTAAVRNDSTLSAQAASMMQAAFGEKANFVPAYLPGGAASEDYSVYVDAGVPSVYFGVGGLDPAFIADYRARGLPVPVNHSPFFAPAPEPTIRTGVMVLTLAVLMVTSAPSGSPAS